MFLTPISPGYKKGLQGSEERIFYGWEERTSNSAYYYKWCKWKALNLVRNWHVKKKKKLYKIYETNLHFCATEKLGKIHKWQIWYFNTKFKIS